MHENVDYRALLVKFLRELLRTDGRTFVERCTRLTNEERRVLRQLGTEAERWTE